MKKWILLVSLLLVISLASTVSADPVGKNDIIRVYEGPGGANGGGLFYVYNATGTNYLFPTFCLEADEYFNPGEQLKVSNLSLLAKVNHYEIQHGYNPMLGGDPLDYRTAYLYYQFRIGNLDDISSFTYNAFGYNALQVAIWFIEQEHFGANNYLVALANSNAQPDNFYGVSVMNLMSKDGTRHKQDMLTMAVPEPGILVLLGIALSAVGLASRRRRL